MNLINKFLFICISSVFSISLTACAPEVGSDAWCEQIEEKPMGERTLNEGMDYAKHCVIK
jgi:hypothetical protein